MVGRVQPDRKQLPLVLLRLLCLLPTGLPVRSVDFNRGTDNITVRQGDTAILRTSVLLPREPNFAYGVSDAWAVFLLL
ncbi:limbic system-associated membrane protein [Lynx pardinus]|uniref:Limbic system-associated membrane protein n=1 Tax=Lynx pardinus TaxID=191816 RepID=A0A485P105_LYNPA|nr:limbic system-associated membrane protein [Lynx pardinus]